MDCPCCCHSMPTDGGPGSRIAYTVPEAAALMGVSAGVLRYAINNSDLIARYPTSRPLVTVDELHDYLKSCPTIPPSEARGRWRGRWLSAARGATPTDCCCGHHAPGGSTKVSYSLDEAAVATGMSKGTITRAIKDGRLTAHYPTSRPVLLPKDIEAWIESSTAVPPSRRRPGE